MKHPVNHAIDTFLRLTPEQQDSVLAILKANAAIASKNRQSDPVKRRKKPGPKPGTPRKKKDATPEVVRSKRRIQVDEDEVEATA